MYNFAEVNLSLEGLTVERLKLNEISPQFDISLFIGEHADGMHLRFQYDAGLFERSTIKRMLGQFRTLLEAIVLKPEARLSELAILTEAERRQLLVER